MSVIGTLIDFIFNNIFVVIAVLFFLVKLMGNASGKKKPTSMPTFGGDQQPRPWHDNDVEEEPDHQAHEQEQRRRQIELEQQRQQELQRAAAQRQRMEASLEARMHNTPVAPPHEPLRRERQRKQALEQQNVLNERKENRVVRAPQAIQLQPNDLRKAVVWSEILGQPRAKRPHRKS